MHFGWDVKEVTGADDRVRKLVFEKEDAIAEAVLYRYPDYKTRTVVCCSTQSGCPVGCTFCGTGRRFVRNLRAGEIKSQVYEALSRTGVKPVDMGRLQVMFMSMGEPWLNMIELDRAIRDLNKELPMAELLVSTAAPILAGITMKTFWDLCRDVKKLGLQFSVHESEDEKRDRLIPYKKKHTLREISLLGETFWQITGRSPFFNYCVHDGNDGEEDAERLLILFDPWVWKATVSVVCETEEGRARDPEGRKRAEGFRDRLTFRGFDCRLFDPAGQDDIGGGCGQLWYVQRWLKEKGR